MTLTRLVNGVRQNLTAQEQIDRESEEIANQAEEAAFELEFGHIVKRRELYPIVLDSLEAIYAGFKHVRDNVNNINLPQVTLDWIAAIEAVDNANPPA